MKSDFFIRILQAFGMPATGFFAMIYSRIQGHIIQDMWVENCGLATEVPIWTAGNNVWPCIHSQHYPERLGIFGDLIWLWRCFLVASRTMTEVWCATHLHWSTLIKPHQHPPLSRHVMHSFFRQWSFLITRLKISKDFWGYFIFEGFFCLLVILLMMTQSTLTLKFLE